MELTGVLAAARRWWLTLAAGAVVAAAVALGTGLLVRPSYQAEVRLLVGPVTGDLDTLRAAGQQARTYAELVSSRPIVSAAAQSVPGSPPAEDIVIDAQADEVTRVLTLQVEAPGRATAAELATALAAQLEEAVDTDLVRPEGEVRVVDPAEVPEGAAWPRLPLLAVLAAAAGLLGALVVVLLLEHLRPAVRTEGQLESLGVAPVVGAVGAVGPLVADVPELALAAEVAIDAAPERGAPGGPDGLGAGRSAATPAKAVAVVPVGPAGPRAALGVAAVLAAQGRRVALIEGGPSTGVADALGLGRDPALGAATVDGALAPGAGRGTDDGAAPIALHRATVVDGADVDVAVWGGGDLAAVDAARAADLLDLVATAADVVVIATAPVDGSLTPLGWARAAGASILVVRQSASRPDAVTGAARALAASGAAPAAALLDVGAGVPRVGSGGGVVDVREATADDHGERVDEPTSEADGDAVDGSTEEGADRPDVAVGAGPQDPSRLDG